MSLDFIVAMLAKERPLLASALRSSGVGTAQKSETDAADAVDVADAAVSADHAVSGVTTGDGLDHEGGSTAAVAASTEEDDAAAESLRELLLPEKNSGVMIKVSTSASPIAGSERSEVMWLLWLLLLSFDKLLDTTGNIK